MKEYNYGADMGSMKIMSENMSCFFDNKYGDGEFKAIVWEEEDNKSVNDEIFGELEFKGHFTSIKDCYLMAYDCSEFKDIEKLHKFKKGRWFVYLDKENIIFHIIKCDDETHS